MDELNSEGARSVSPVEWLVELAAVGILLFWIVYLRSHWPDLPDEVPKTFGFSGQPTSVGAKTDLWVLPSIGIILYCALTFLSRQEHLYSLPVEITPENSAELHVFCRKFINLVKLGVISLFGYTEWKTIQTARGDADGLGSWFMPSLVGIILLTGAFLTLRLWRYRAD